MFSLHGNYVFLHFTWNLVLFTSYPVGASLYNIDTRLCSQCTTPSSFKCMEKIRWRRLFIDNGYEEKQTKIRKFGYILTEI